VRVPRELQGDPLLAPAPCPQAPSADRLEREARAAKRADARRAERRKDRATQAHAHNQARLDVMHALRAGRLQRQPCQVCGAEPAQAHHDDYADALRVRWLCKKHHDALHAARDKPPGPVAGVVDLC